MTWRTSSRLSPLLVLLLLAGGGSAAGQGGLPALGNEERASLETGELLIERLEPTGGGGVAVRAMRLIDAPPARVWPVVRDCGEFDQFMPRVKESEARRDEAGAATCYIVMEMPFPISDLHSEVRSVVRDLPGDGQQRSWTLYRGDYRRSDGSWSVLPWGPPPAARTLLIYHLDAEPASIVPDFVIRAAQSRSLPGAFEAIAERATLREAD